LNVGARHFGVPLVACGVAAACACSAPAVPTSDVDGGHVRVSQPGAVVGCDYVGDFMSGGGARPVWSPWASRQVRDHAAAYGATDVVLGFTLRGDTIGNGYRCPGQGPTAAWAWRL
jgi:hypothetical protein